MVITGLLKCSVSLFTFQHCKCHHFYPSVCGVPSRALSFISPFVISTFTKDLLFLYCVLSLGTWCMTAWLGSHHLFSREKQRTLKPPWICLNGRSQQNCFIATIYSFAYHFSIKCLLLKDKTKSIQQLFCPIQAMLNILQT